MTSKSKGKAASDAHSHRHRSRTTIAKDKLAELREKAGKADQYLDALQRKTAEFENYRKRAAREREEFRTTATENLMAELLPVIDNFERAIEAAKQSEDFQSLLEGVSLTERQMLDVLSRFGLKRMEVVGREFDPRFHEAFSRESSDEHPENVIVSEVRRGYMLGEKVLRPALVCVSSGPPQGEEGQ